MAEAGLPIHAPTRNDEAALPSRATPRAMPANEMCPLSGARPMIHERRDNHATTTNDPLDVALRARHARPKSQRLLGAHIQWLATPPRATGNI